MPSPIHEPGYPKNQAEDDTFDVSDSAKTKATADVLNGTAQSQLRTVIERIERMEEDKAALMADLKEIYGEAKGNGFDVKVIRKVVRLRKMDKAKRQEEDAILDLYMVATGSV